MAKRPKSKKKAQEERRVFLVVVDDSEELHQALYFACCRAKRLKGRVALMHCIRPAEFQHFAGVGELMREEARAQAEELLRVNSERVNELTGETPMVYLREGEPGAEVLNVIDEHKDISILILGANTKGDSTGPLINYLTNKGAADCHVPVTIVPGNLSDEDIDRLT